MINHIHSKNSIPNGGMGGENLSFCCCYFHAKYDIIYENDSFNVFTLGVVEVKNKEKSSYFEIDLEFFEDGP